MRLVRQFPAFDQPMCCVSEIKSDVKSTDMYALILSKLLLYHCLAAISPQQAFYALVHRQCPRP